MKEFIFVLILAALPLLTRSKDAPTHAILVSGPGHSRSGCGANMSFDVSNLGKKILIYMILA
jgi:hypothetical protein